MNSFLFPITIKGVGRVGVEPRVLTLMEGIFGFLIHAIFVYFVGQASTLLPPAPCYGFIMENKDI